MSLDTRLAAFVEYVIRPLSEDWRLILDQLKTLNIGISQEVFQRTIFALGLWHLVGEVIRACCYLGITWMICQTLITIWKCHSPL